MPKQKNAEPREGRPGAYLVALYNMDEKALTEFMHRGARGFIQKVDKRLIPKLPKWVRVTTLHLRDFKGIVNRWVEGQLTNQDYEVILAFIADRLDKMTHTQRLLHPPPASLRRVLIAQIKKNPLEPFTKAYLELYDLMQLEDRGALQFRPRYCELCKTLFLPIRPSLQRACSKKCSHFVRYQRYVARLQQASEEAFRLGLQREGEASSRPRSPRARPGQP